MEFVRKRLANPPLRGLPHFAIASKIAVDILSYFFSSETQERS